MTEITPWCFPLQKSVIGATANSNSFQSLEYFEVEIPIGQHVGAFAVKRKHHIHEGIDLYCQEGDEVIAVEDGIVVAIEDFTGPKAGYPWWLDTQACLVEGATGVVVYGEIETNLEVGTEVKRGQHIGQVKRVLAQDKGRPRDMLHLELHKHGTRQSFEWATDQEKPESLLDPTPFILAALPMES